MVRTEAQALKRFGFFTEMAAEYPVSIRACLGPLEGPTKEMCRYLRAGRLFIASPGLILDVVDQSCGRVGTGSVLTDGVWAWRDDTAHYVEKHGLRVPDELLKRMRDLRFNVPSVGLQELRRLRL